jgi:arabinose-5-phosphate isomerase
LLSCRRFKQEDFRRFHPGGSLGERLAVKVSEVMLTEDHVPIVPLDAKVKQAIVEINNKKIGATLVVGDDQKLVGMITDGDLRRALLNRKAIHQLDVSDIMSPSPKTVNEDQTAAEALALMELHAITHLAIVDRENRVKGLVHLHDLLGREEFRINGSNDHTPGTHR